MLWHSWKFAHLPLNSYHFLAHFKVRLIRNGNIQLYAYNICIVIVTSNIGEPELEEAVMLGRMG
jgi:hypothetical protein